MKIWTGTLTLNGERKKAGKEVMARIIVAGSAAVLFEVSEDGGKQWRLCDASEVHADSWLRALGETGKEVP